MKKTFFILLTLALFGFGLIAKADAPLTPVNISAVPASLTSINLSWDVSPGATGYEIFRGGTTTPIATTNLTNYVDSSLTPGATYTYYLNAYDASSTKSALSAGVSATTLADTVSPTIPASLSAVAMSASQINLSWTAATDNIAVTGYKIYQGGYLIASTSGLNYNKNGLSASTTYVYNVASYDAAGNASSQSVAATATTFVAAPDSAIPTVPTNLIATPISSSQINLAWTASTDDVGVAGYRVFRNGTQIATTTHIYYTSSGLTAATSYTYNVSAFDAVGNTSAASPELTVSTLASGQSATGNVNAQIINGDKRGKFINYRSNEIILLAIFSDANFSARTIKNNTVALGKATPVIWQLKDVNKDGKIDRVYGFRARDLKNLNAEENILVFSATTKAGQQIYASVTVKVKNAPNKYRENLQKKIDQLQKQIDNLKNKLNNVNANVNNWQERVTEKVKQFKENIKEVKKEVKNNSNYNKKLGKK